MDSEPLSDASSGLSSPPSCSPSPPPEFFRMRFPPSPSSSQHTSAKSSPRPDEMASGASGDEDGPPPAKRRKLAEPKPRTTAHLDLRSGDVDPSQKAQLDSLLKVLHKKKKIVVVAGAGISVSAGIPDFRSSDGLFSTLRAKHNLKSSGKHLFDASVYKDDASTSSFHEMVREMSRETKKAQPTAFHHMLATLAAEDRLLRLYSQNVDGIDTSLEPLATKIPLPRKEPWPKTVQLHGGLDTMVCSKCHEMSPFRSELFDGPSPPACEACAKDDEVRTQHAGKRSHGVGRLRPRMVLYNEQNPDDEAIGSVTKADLRRSPDAVIVVGTTLKVPGVRRIVREMCGVVRSKKGCMTIWINNDPPPKMVELKDAFDLVVQGPCDAVASLAALHKWDEPPVLSEVTDEEILRAKQSSQAKVEIVSPRKPRVVECLSGSLPTPIPSPRLKTAQLSRTTSSTPEPSTPTKLRKMNPASKGQPLDKVLGPIKPPATKKPTKPKKAPATKKAPAKSKATKVTKTTATIKSTFTVSKAAKAGPANTKPKQVPSRPRSQSKSNPTKELPAPVPMEPVSPQSARNNSWPNVTNGPPPMGDLPQLKIKGINTTPGGIVSPIESDTIEVQTESRRSSYESCYSGTISPTGRVPDDMKRLIDFE